jgi:hypothetical protein
MGKSLKILTMAGFILRITESDLNKNMLKKYLICLGGCILLLNMKVPE